MPTEKTWCVLSAEKLWRRLALSLVVAVTGSACSGSSSTQASATTKPRGSAPATTVRSAVVASVGGRIQLDGAELMLAPGALSSDATVTATTLRPPPVTPQLGAAVGPAVHFDLGGARLLHPASLSLPVHVSAGQDAGGAYLDESSSRWIPAGGRLDASRSHVILNVSHLSWWAPWTWEINSFRDALSKLLSVGVTFRAPPPTCSSPPAGVHLAEVSSDPSDPPLIGCVEAANSTQIRVRVINNRAFGTVVKAPGDTQLAHASRGAAVDAFLQSPQAAAGLDGEYLPPGGQADYLAAATGGAESFTSKYDYRALGLTIATDMLLMNNFGPVANELIGVGKCLADRATADPPTNARDVVQQDIECLGALDVKNVFLAPLAMLQGVMTDVASAFDTGQDRANGVTGRLTLNRKAPVARALPPAFIGQWRAHASAVTITADGRIVIGWSVNDQSHLALSGDVEVDLRITSTRGPTIAAVVTASTVPAGLDLSSGPGVGPALSVGESYSLTLAPPGLVGAQGIQWCDNETFQSGVCGA